LRTSGRSSPGLRARRSSNGDGEPSSGRRGYGGGALRARSERERGFTGAQMGERVRASGARGSSGQRRVSSELHARRGRGEGGREQLGGGYAGTTGLTARARDAEREKKAGAGAREAGLTGWAHVQRESEGAGARGEAAAPTGRARCAEREGGKRRARGGPTGPKGRGGRVSGLLCLFLLF
jgi:hypothetical protein